MTKTSAKSLVWIGDSIDVVKSFTANAKKDVGYQLNLIQEGKEPADWKPMEIVGTGVREIRIKAEKACRVLYVAKFPEAVYVLHAFEKKTQKTSKSEIVLANTRYRQMLIGRKSK